MNGLEARMQDYGELEMRFTSLGEWRDFWHKNSASFGKEFADSIANHVMAHGLVEPLTGQHYTPAEITRGEDLREGLVARGMNSRQRAVLKVVAETIDINRWPALRIYAPEAITPFAMRFRGMFPKYIGSEFTLDPDLRREMYPIPFEDLMSLSLPDNSFDLVCTNEVLEHVPSIDRALKEIARILKPGCWHIGTQPLLFQDESIIKTTLENGKLIHHMPPDYHGDPFGGQGSLVFELPGWNILDRARQAGFSHAEFRMVISRAHGSIAYGGMGIYVLCLQK